MKAVFESISVGREKKRIYIYMNDVIKEIAGIDEAGFG